VLGTYQIWRYGRAGALLLWAAALMALVQALALPILFFPETEAWPLCSALLVQANANDVIALNVCSTVIVMPPQTWILQWDHVKLVCFLINKPKPWWMWTYPGLSCSAHTL
jgi:hypothetical protein